MSASAPTGPAAADRSASAVPGDPRPSDRVPTPWKVAYGAAGMTEQLVGMITKQMFNPVFNIGLGISPAVIGVVLMSYRLWDAVTDLLFGNISDNARTRWGRRRPFIVIGGVLTGLAMPLLWQASPNWSQGTIIAYMVVMGMLLYSCFTLWSMPYYSLGMEMTPDYDERTRIVSWRAFFSKTTVLLGGWLLALASLPVFSRDPSGAPDIARGMRFLGWGIGAIIVVVAILPGLVVRERYYEAVKSRPRVNLWQSLRATGRCRPFLLVMGVYVCQTLGSSLVASLGLYLNIYYVCGGDLKTASVIQGVKSTVIFLPGLLSVPFWVWVCEKLGKKAALRLTILMGFVANLLVLVCYTPEHPYLQIVPQIFLSSFGSALWMIIPSMQADIVDHDELHTGQRREGGFASISSWVGKFSSTITTGLSGFIIVWCGFDLAKYGAQQPPEVLRTMLRWYVFLPAPFWCAALLMLHFYPITSPVAHDIRRQLEERRGRL